MVDARSVAGQKCFKGCLQQVPCWHSHWRVSSRYQLRRAALQRLKPSHEYRELDWDGRASCGRLCAQLCGYPGHTISWGYGVSNRGPRRHKNYRTVTAENFI